MPAFRPAPVPTAQTPKSPGPPALARDHGFRRDRPRRGAGAGAGHARGPLPWNWMRTDATVCRRDAKRCEHTVQCVHLAEASARHRLRQKTQTAQLGRGPLRDTRTSPRSSRKTNPPCPGKPALVDLPRRGFSRSTSLPLDESQVAGFRESIPVRSHPAHRLTAFLKECLILFAEVNFKYHNTQASSPGHVQEPPLVFRPLWRHLQTTLKVIALRLGGICHMASVITPTFAP